MKRATRKDPSGSQGLVVFLNVVVTNQPYTALTTLFVVVALIAAELLPIVSSATIAASSSFFQGCASNFFLINAVES